MYPESELTLSEVVNESAVFWSRGNAPSQRDEGLTAKEVRLHLASAYLLAEKVLASASFYFESQDTRDVTKEFSKLFHEKSIVYFVDESMDGFTEHALRKAEKSPPELQCYHNSELVSTAGKALNDLGVILRRPDISVSAEIERLWLADVITDSGVLGSVLVRTAVTKEQLLRWREAVSDICRQRGDRDFVWEYLGKALCPLDLPHQFMRVGRRRVGNLYAQATSRVLGVPSDNATRLDGRTAPEVRYDTSLFLECMDTIGLKEHLAKLDAAALIRLKTTVEFTTFRAFYFALVDAAHHNGPSLRELMRFYSQVENRVVAGDSERELVVNALFQLFGRNAQAKVRYRRPLDIILSVYGASGIVVIRDLYAIVAALAQPSAPARCEGSLIAQTSGLQAGLKGTEQPLALIMKGGGIKGLAYIGALAELTKYYSFNWYAGTSAGAIVAILLSAGYKIGELELILRNKNFKDFLDAGWMERLMNLIVYKGLHKAHTFEQWIDRLLATKLASPTRVLLKDLVVNRVTIYACRRGQKAVIFDSRIAGSRDTPAAFAVRCSMSVPFVFTPMSQYGMRMFDGGLKQNYPIEELLADHPETSFVGMYLGAKVYEGQVKASGLLSDLWNISLEATDEEALAKHKDRTVIIDPRPVSTLDLELVDIEKDFLIKEGAAAALAFLQSQGVAGIDSSSVTKAAEEADQARSLVFKFRRRRRKRKIAAWLSIVIALAGYVLWRYCPNFGVPFSGSS